jgi:hypothetical protein
MRRLDALVKLPKGWDGYAGRPVSFPTANFAVSVLEAIMPPGAIAPQIVPGAAGDLQLEWHAPHGSIELQIFAPNRGTAWRLVNGAEEEVNVTIDYGLVADWLVQFMEFSVAPGSSAAG